MKNTMITRNINKLDLNIDQKEKLDEKIITEFYEDYKKNHKYITLSKVANDFLFECLQINPRLVTDTIKLLKKGLKYEFLSLLKKDKRVRKYSKRTYEICDKIVNNNNFIPELSKKGLISKIKHFDWNLNKENNIKFKIDDKKFSLSNDKLKILLALLEKEMTIDEMTCLIDNKSTVPYYIKYFSKFDLIDKYRLSQGYRGGSITFYKIKDQLLKEL